MNESFEVELTAKPDGPLVSFGPIDPQTGWRLEIPRTLVRRVTYPALKLEVILDCVFSGERLEVASISITGIGAYVATRDLTQLGIPTVMSAIVATAVPDSERWCEPLPSDNPNRITSPGYLAQLYWFQHIGWGAPRSAIMKYMGWSRANANFHIKKFTKTFPLPGSHADSTVSSTTLA